MLDVYEDFQCPICDAFEKANGAAVQKLARRGKVRVVYHPFTIFLGEQPAQDNSVRAWAASQRVPAGSWMRYHSLLLALGRKMGLTSASFTQCVSAQTSPRRPSRSASRSSRAASTPPRR